MGTPGEFRVLRGKCRNPDGGANGAIIPTGISPRRQDGLGRPRMDGGSHYVYSCQ